MPSAHFGRAYPQGTSRHRVRGLPERAMPRSPPPRADRNRTRRVGRARSRRPAPGSNVGHPVEWRKWP